MKRLAPFFALLLLLTGCGTTKTYTPKLAAGPPKPENYPIPVYSLNMRVPRPCELIGRLSIGDTQLTMFGGSMPEVMKTIMTTAHEKGADVVVLTSIKSPEFESAHYRVTADLLRYTDVWESVSMSDNDFLIYLQQHRQTLDPIEGIWLDAAQDRIGIMRDNTKRGRNFIAFTLNVPLPSWQKGYKKLDIALTDRPGAYSLKYYRDDFEPAKTTILLDQGRRFSFILNKDDKVEEIAYVKTFTPLPLH